MNVMLQSFVIGLLIKQGKRFLKILNSIKERKIENYLIILQFYFS